MQSAKSMVKLLEQGYKMYPLLEFYTVKPSLAIIPQRTLP